MVVGRMILGDVDRGHDDRGGLGRRGGEYIVYWAFLGHLGTIMRGTDATESSSNSQA